jgi:hypothetical protein
MNEPVALSIAADIASFVGLVITFVVAVQVRKIKAALLLNSRIPEGIRDLQAASDELLETLKDWPNLELQARAHAQRIDGILANFIPKLDGIEKRQLKRAQSLIKQTKSIRYRVFPQTESERRNAMWDVYLTLVGGVEVLRQRNKDYKKRV